ncbi:MAG TPA: hypothetical protein VF350_02340 [Candidatus Bathyarchaeia archaeon]
MNKKTKAVAATITSLVVVVAIITAIFANQSVTPKSTPLLYRIVDASFTVDPGSYKAYNFTMPSDTTYSGVSGTFNVTTPNSSDFRVFIWDNAAFTNWQANGASLHLGFGVISFYDSGWSTNGTINSSSYPGGTYWVIYTNNSTKVVNVTTEVSFYYIPK